MHIRLTVSLDQQFPDGNCNQVPVSIADLGGTEIDLRFSSPQEGNISVVVAPVLRFSSSKEFISNLKGGRLHCFKFLSNT